MIESFLYRSQFQPVVWLNPDGTTRATFVYGLHANVPDYMVQNGATYRLISDQVGSIRLVVNASTGAIVERIDWDEFGNVLNDTAPGTQPFGFAGGLRDVDTGLTRFGARDYDPAVGRWTAKDPLAFRGRLTNLYEYVGGDPINRVDPSGLKCRSFWSAFADNFMLTNQVVPGALAPWGMGLLTGAAVAQFMNGITLFQWVVSGFAGATYGAATFTVVETAVIVGATAVTTFALTGIAFEVGVAYGSLIQAGWECADTSCGG